MVRPLSSGVNWMVWFRKCVPLRITTVLGPAYARAAVTACSSVLKGAASVPMVWCDDDIRIRHEVTAHTWASIVAGAVVDVEHSIGALVDSK